MARVLPLLAAVLVVAGCGAAAETGIAPADAVFQAQSRTAGVSSYRVWMTGGTKLPGGEAIGFQAEGEFDNETRRGRMTMTMDQLGRMELVLDGLVMYMRMPALARTAPELKPWIRVDLRALGKLAGVDLAGLMELGGQQDPTRSLDQLRAAKDVREVGTETVRGVETTHFRATVDLAEHARTLEREQPALGKAIRHAIRLSGQKQVPMEVWVGDDQLVRRLQWTQRVQGASTTMIMELYDFGADVQVRIPAKDRVTDLERLLEQGS